MKPSNPMQQLQQWKANNGKSNKLKNELVKSANQPNSGLVKNTQGNVGSETKNKSQGITFCRDNQSTLKDFNQANDYLIHKFGEVIKQIEQLQVENIEKQKLINEEK